MSQGAYRHKKGGTYLVSLTATATRPLAEGDVATLFARGGRAWICPLAEAAGLRSDPSAQVLRRHVEIQASSPIPGGGSVICYVAQDGTHWGRPEAEFLDGRFEKIA